MGHMLAASQKRKRLEGLRRLLWPSQCDTAMAGTDQQLTGTVPIFTIIATKTTTTW